MAINTKRIAKNTVFLYARLILVLGVSLYTSRVVLDKLGVDDYGLYNVVFGVIGLLSFLNGTLSIGTSRFITYDLGRGDPNRLQTTFSTALCAHLLLSLIIVLFGETAGLWYVHHVMVCPPDRFHAALIVYQISILFAVISILQVPFTSSIMAHERMDVYAYIGIYEAIAKLLVVYFLTRTAMDKLILYAVLLVLVAITVFLANVLFSFRRFDEVQFKWQFDKDTFTSIVKFSGWNILANISNTLMMQGVIMLFNLFFQPFVVAAQAISNQISNAFMQFVNNVRQAVNPQVIKLYADQKYKDSKKLTLQSAEYIFDLLLLLGVPLILIMPNLLNLWLVEVPEYAVDFARFIVFQNILDNFNAAFYTPMVAANKIKKNAIAAAVLCTIQFGLLYLLFRVGLGPMWSRYVGLLFCVIWSFLVKPYILWKYVDYTWAELFLCSGRCLRVLVLVTIPCCVVYVLLPQTDLWCSLLVALLAIIIVLFVSYVSLGRELRMRLWAMLGSKFHFRFKND